MSVKALLVIVVLAFVVWTGQGPMDGGSSASQAGSAATQCPVNSGEVAIKLSAAKYPNIKRHADTAIAKGAPCSLTLTRENAQWRREQAVKTKAAKPGYDRDEYPPAVGRTLVASDVDYVPMSENRSHGATLGAKLSEYPDGTRFVYVWR